MMHLSLSSAGVSTCSSSMNCFCFMSSNLDCSEKSEVEDGKKGEGNQHLEIRMKGNMDKDM